MSRTSSALGALVLDTLLAKAATWDEAQHPRQPAGAPESTGGEFRDAESTFTPEELRGLLTHWQAEAPNGDWKSPNLVLRNLNGKALGPDDELLVFHGTDGETATKFLRGEEEDKPLTLARERYESGQYASYSPGNGLSPHLYVSSRPNSAEGFGRAVIAMKVKLRDLELAPEQKQYGYRSPLAGLPTTEGAVLPRQKFPSVEHRYLLDMGGYVPSIDHEPKLRLLRGVDSNAVGAPKLRKYDETQHPRVPKGTPVTGGRWREKGPRQLPSIPVQWAKKGQRAWDPSTPAVLSESSKKYDTGMFGEQLIVSYLRQLAGEPNADKFDMRPKKSPPFDVRSSRGLYEVKTGLASNSRGAQQWRISYNGDVAKKAIARIKALGITKPSRINKQMQLESLQRKVRAHALLQRQEGRSLAKVTYAVIWHPDKRLADIYRIPGLHLRVGWRSALAKASYQGTVKYGTPR